MEARPDAAYRAKQEARFVPDAGPAILVRLDRIGLEDLQELIVEAWLARAPTRLAKTYLDTSL